MKYDIPPYIGSLTTVCRSDACYSYASKHQSVCLMSRYTTVTHILFYNRNIKNFAAMVTMSGLNKMV